MPDLKEIEVRSGVNGNILYLHFVHVYPTGQGLGLQAMVEVLKRAMEAKCMIIRLDDMSSRYRKSHNLYTKVGFVYDSSLGCEMSCRTSTLSRHMRSFEIKPQASSMKDI